MKDKNKKSSVIVRIVYAPLPPPMHEDQGTEFGIQYADQQIHHANKVADDIGLFELELPFRQKEESKQILFSGPYVHGSGEASFLYLSWKKMGESENPWIHRIKIPLFGITAEKIEEAEGRGGFIEANVSGRKPHSGEGVIWDVK